MSRLLIDTIDITITLTSGAGDTCRGCGYSYAEMWVWLTSVKCKVTVKLCLLMICMGGAVPAENHNNSITKYNISNTYSPGVMLSNGTTRSLKFGTAVGVAVFAVIKGAGLVTANNELLLVVTIGAVFTGAVEILAR